MRLPIPFLLFTALFGLVPFDGAALQVVLETGNKIPVCFPGQTAKPVLKITADTPINEEVQLRVTMYDGKVLLNRKWKLALPQNAKQNIELPLPKRFGVCNVEFFSKQLKGGCSRQSYAFFKPAGPGKIEKEGFMFGIQTFSFRAAIKDPVKADKMRYATALCGAKVLREPADWANLQPHPGKPVDFSRLDKEIKACNELGVRVALLLNNGPSWAAVKNYTPIDKRRKHRWNKVPDAKLWAEFAAKTASRYDNSQITSLELFNEPDLSEFFNGTAAQYLTVIRAGAAEIRKTAPEMPILSGGFSDSFDMSSKGGEEKFLEKVLANGQDNYDIFAIHMHGTFPTYLRQVQEMERLFKKYKHTKPWWPNETAYHTLMISDEQQAAILFQKLIYSWSRGAVGYVWHSLNENRQRDGSLPHDFGLLTPELQPKSPYVAYNMLATYFGQAEYKKNFADNQSDIFAYLFRGKNGDLLIPLWKLDADKVLLSFGNVSGKAVLVDLFGNETPLAVKNSTVTILLQEYPCTLVIRNSKTTPVWYGPLFASKTKLQKDRFVLEMPLFNPDKTKPMEISCRILQGELSPNFAKTSLPPGGKGKLQFTVPSGKLGELQFKCDLRFGDLWSGTFADSTILPGVIAEKFPKKPHFELKKTEQLVNLTPMGADYMDEHWKGPADVSAAFFLRTADRTLHIRAEVTDDIHVPSEKASDLWKTDSLQLGLQLPRQKGFWLFGLADGKNGTQSYIWYAPAGYSMQKSAAKIRLKVRRDEAAKKTVYDCELPYSAIGLTQAKGKDGFKLNMLVNDNDGKRREGFLRLTPGIGNTPDPEHWRSVVFQ